MSRHGAKIVTKKKVDLERLAAWRSEYHQKMTLAEFDRLHCPPIPPVRRPIWLGRAGRMGEA